MKTVKLEDKEHNMNVYMILGGQQGWGSSYKNYWNFQQGCQWTAECKRDWKIDTQYENPIWPWWPDQLLFFCCFSHLGGRGHLILFKDHYIWTTSADTKCCRWIADVLQCFSFYWGCRMENQDVSNLSDTLYCLTDSYGHFWGNVLRVKRYTVVRM